VTCFLKILKFHQNNAIVDSFMSALAAIEWANRKIDFTNIFVFAENEPSNVCLKKSTFISFSKLIQQRNMIIIRKTKNHHIHVLWWFLFLVIMHLQNNLSFPHHILRTQKLTTVFLFVRANIRTNLWAHLWANLWAHLWTNLWANLWTYLWAYLWANLWTNLWANLWTYLWAYLWANLWANLWAHLWAYLWANLWTNLWTNLWANIW
jgi:hypothetical protein